MRKDISLDNVKGFVYEWNAKFPIDRWWREKHKVPFMSKVHRESSFIDQLIEYREDVMYEEAFEKYRKKQDGECDDNVYIPGKGNFVKPEPVKMEMTDEEFNDIDLSKF